jgi:RHS repeat-associated protein
MKRRINLTLALTLSLILGVSPILTVASSRNPTRTISSPKSALPFRLPKRAKRVSAQAQQNAVQLEGQTTTLLPGGRLLLIGGLQPDGQIAPGIIYNPRTGESVLLADKSLVRAWHSATMLPDGRVLIVGGIDANGQVLQSAGVFDPEKQDFMELPKSGVTPRAYHSATLLTDGRVLIVGGVSAKGGQVSKAELWNFKTEVSKTAVGKLSVQRAKARTTLLSDGNVLIDGGFDRNGNEVRNSELFNSEAESFSFTTISSEPVGTETPFLTGSLPRDGATDVEIDGVIALRFSKPLQVEGFKSDTLKLTRAGQPINAKVTLAESGRLAFIFPKQALEKGITYTVTCIDGDDDTNRVTPAVFSFTTKTDKRDETNEGLPNQSMSDVDWVPNAENLRGNWKSKGEKSSWQDQPSLQAPPGETALSGQVLTLRGQPLANVTISIDGHRTSTDHTGRFLLQDISSGHQVMVIDGRSASRPGATFGIFRGGVDLTPNQTNVLPYTIWMPKLDMAHATSIPSPNKQEVVITNPLIPGLELHLPAGTVIRDLDGKAVTEITITPVPTDRPPFPLPPGINVPVFASIQPGGARVIPPRARLIYPNYINERPGARINFWNYDPEGKGWYIYGQGTVSANGKQIIPDTGVVIYEFTGIMFGSSGDPASKAPKAGNGPGNQCCDPVDTGTGLFVQTNTDLVVADTLPIRLRRTYRPEDNASRAFGIGATHQYEMFLWSINNYQEVDLILPDGGRIHYVRISPGTGWTDAVYEHTTTPSVFYKSRISWNGSGWDLRFKDGTVYVFPEFAPLQSIRDRYGNQITITRSGGNSGNITQVTSPNGRWLQFTYDGSNRIAQAKDNSGRTISYAYDAGGRLWKVTDAAGVTEYTYDNSNRMLTLKDAREIVYLTNEYNSAGRVIKQTQADNSTYQIAYTLDTNGEITQTDVTDPRGYIRRITFNSDGYTISETLALGTTEQQTYTYGRQPGTNLLLSVTDQLSRTTSFTYDAMGNLASVTRLSGTSEAVTTTIMHEPSFNQVSSVTDPLNHTTAFGYDPRGNLTSIIDALSHQTTFAYNTAGQPLSVTDPLQHTIQFTYDSGDLVSITDPLERTSTFLVDGLGRPIAATNPLGQRTLYQYDALNRQTQFTDPLQGVTDFGYDPNGNLLSLTDARNNVMSYVYNDMDRATTREDQLLHDETYQYDPNGNLSQVTDRKGQITSYGYDPLNRLTQITYADSTTSLTYDGGDRLTQIVNSLSGTITFSYDNLDRLTSKTTPQGTIGYTYDAAGRRTSMSVAGQSTVNYTYDNADRLTKITQGSATVTIAYDDANRRTSLTLPNGIVTEYEYDDASQLTGISYKHGTNTLGDLTYVYDAAGRRTMIGGSYARSGLPPAVTTASYNAANQQTAFGSQSLSYDLNGNLTSDGTNTYVWNSRDQLASMTGPGLTASFQYDAFGRRINKTVNGTTTSYLYDGANLVQEQSAGSPTANILAGALDEVFIRSDAQGTWNFLIDGLGSTLALTDSTGTVQTDYTYEPFGKTITSGNSSGNPSQYTGRENDGTGLYYFRSRYYSSSLQRFISEDPIGFLGGINLYAYVDNDPISYRDPFGLKPKNPGDDADGDATGLVAALRGVVDQALQALQNMLSVNEAVTGAPISVVGGLSRAEQLKANREQGKAAERRVGQELVDEGNEILGSQVTVRTSEGRRVPDHLILNPSDEILAVEVKSGNGVRTEAQILKDGIMAKTGATIIGKNAPPHLRGKFLKIVTILRR